ncbi:hypothetical protein [Streptomyces sp. NPDC052225]|uniref:hypothetical protein n=1 Tax=Streptomyces sp. NPDC052225 TaxID=3154949 RepID=UPI003442FA81
MSGARRAVRMCVRCQRTTDEPVLVHEVHAATGPGFNVYACPECAPTFPPMTDVLEQLPPQRRRSRMTIRVYDVTVDGVVVRERGETWVRGAADPRAATPDVTTTRPPASRPPT